MTDLISKKYAAADKKRCAACGACMHECPRQAIIIWKGCYARIDAGSCAGCGRCEAVCPAGSISIQMREDGHE